MADIQEIYSILLTRGYQEALFADLTRKARDGRHNMRADCPFCQPGGDGSRGLFSYSLTKPVWRCFGCQREKQASGDWLGYLMARSRLDFKEALLLLAKEAGVEAQISQGYQASYKAYAKKADLLEAAQELFARDLQAPAGQAVLQYLLARGYTEAEIQSMELGAFVARARIREELLQQGYSEQEIKESGLLTGGFGETHTLTLLWRDAAGRAIGLATRTLLDGEELKAKGIQDKYKYSYGLRKDQGLIGLSSARGSKYVTLVEGVLDALYLNAMGLTVVAVGGTSLSPAQIKALEASGTKHLLLALDSDKAGQDATAMAIQALSVSKIRPYVVQLPAGYKDPDELVRAKGVLAFQDVLQKAEGWPKWMARHLLSRHDLTTDRGLDEALEEALEAHARIQDSMEARAFLETLRASTGLSEEDLARRAQEQQQKASQRKAQEVLQGLIKAVQDKARAGDIIAAELELVEGLRALRSDRGVEPPQPYLLEGLLADLLSTPEGLYTGYKALDDMARIPVGALTIVAGRPGHGKTTLLLNLLINLVRAYPERRFYFFSYEEARKMLALKLIMLMAGKVLQAETNQGAYINYFKEKRGNKQADRDIERAILEYDQLTASGRLVISDQMLSAEDLASTIGYLAKSGDVGAVLVDYIQRVPLRQPLNSQRYLEIKLVSSLLLQQAVSSDIPIILGAQLGRDKSSGSKVRLDNLRESGDIEQDANLVIGLYNPSVEKTEEGDSPDKSREVDLQVSVLKNRGGMAGRSCSLTFERPVLRIKDTGSKMPW